MGKITATGLYPHPQTPKGGYLYQLSNCDWPLIMDIWFVKNSRHSSKFFLCTSLNTTHPNIKVSTFLWPRDVFLMSGSDKSFKLAKISNKSWQFTPWSFVCRIIAALTVCVFIKIKIKAISKNSRGVKQIVLLRTLHQFSQGTLFLNKLLS